MSKEVEKFFPELKAASLRDQLEELRAKLAVRKTLEVHRNEHGMYPASATQSHDAASGYQNAWLRDNVMVAFSKWACGDAQSAMDTVRGLTAFLKTQARKIERIIEKPKRKEDVDQRPHIRFNAKEVRENDESWAHAQNDALGEMLWLRFLLANESGFALDGEERELFALFPAYFAAIQYWKDADSGAWEEARKVNSSSVGAVMAGLEQMGKHLREGASLRGVKEERLLALAARGARTLDE